VNDPNAAASDLSIWLSAPKERTAAYFPTYSAISRKMQAALRLWVREWFGNNSAVLAQPNVGRTILVYICTHPFPGKRTNTFTYDVQVDGMLEMALASAARKLRTELTMLRTEHLKRNVREAYFPYRSGSVVQYVRQNSRAFVKMLNVETALVNGMLNFAVTDVPCVGLGAAVNGLRKTFETHLRRFSAWVSLEDRSDQLVSICTGELWKIRSSATPNSTESSEIIC
jgi:hypothetical protein